MIECADQWGAGADRRHSRHKESIRTVKGMAIPAVPRSDDRSVYQHHVGRGEAEGGSGDDDYFTGGAGGTSQVSRRGGAGAPLQSSTKFTRPRKGSNSQVRFCGKAGVVGKMCFLWEKCDYSFPAGFIATFGGQGTCCRVAIVNGRTESTPRATASVDIVWGGGGGGGRGVRAGRAWLGGRVKCA